MEKEGGNNNEEDQKKFEENQISPVENDESSNFEGAEKKKAAGSLTEEQWMNKYRDLGIKLYTEEEEAFFSNLKDEAAFKLASEVLDRSGVLKKTEESEPNKEATQEISQEKDSPPLFLTYQEKILIDSISPYFEGSGLLQLINKENIHQYIDKREAEALADTRRLPTFQQQKRPVLMQIFQKALWKRENDSRPAKYANKQGLKNTIKELFTLPFNNEVYEAIASLKQAENSNFDLDDRIKNYYSKAMETREEQYKLGRTDKEINRLIEYHIKKLKEVFLGMQHEIAFSEFLTTFDETDLFTILDATPEQDSRGVDFFIASKVKLNKNNQYVFASEYDILNNNYKTAIVPIDIKSSRDNAYKIKKDKLKTYDSMDLEKLRVMDNLSLPLWSHIYSGDFKLRVEKTIKLNERLETIVTERAVLDPNKNSLFLNYNEEMPAIKLLNKTQTENRDRMTKYMKSLSKNQKIKYTNSSNNASKPVRSKKETEASEREILDKNQMENTQTKNNLFLPMSSVERMGSIKKEILFWVNTFSDYLEFVSAGNDKELQDIYEERKEKSLAKLKFPSV